MDKESLEEAFKEYGIPKEKVERFDEKMPGFWDLFKTDKARYLHFMKEAIFKFARDGNGILLGRGGQILLAGLPGVLRVRIIAPLEIRKKSLVKRFDYDDAHAEKLILHTDYERAGFHKFFFGENQENPDLYDLVLNTAFFNVNTAAKLIKDIAETDEFKAAQNETIRRIEDLCLENEVKTAVIFKEKILVQFLEVMADNGVVVLRGIVDNTEDLERCEKIAAELQGVKSVKNEIYYSPITVAYGLHY